MASPTSPTRATPSSTAAFGPLADPPGLAAELDGRADVAAHGLFLGLATDLVVAGPSGVRHVTAMTATARELNAYPA